MSDTANPQVSVDYGDLLEACESANAWASYLRKEKDNHDAADRIDSAVSRLRRSAERSS